MKKLLLICFISVLQAIAFTIQATDSYVKHTFANDFCIAKQGLTASIMIDFRDFKGVVRAASDLQSDIQKVTDNKPEFSSSLSEHIQYAIIIGTIGKSQYIDQLIHSGKIKTASINNQWEAFSMQVVEKPFPNVEQALVIAGSDKRGTIYGIYDLSQQIGISPWYWFADVAPQKQNILTISRNFSKEDRPAVKYRGIFINDEAPALSSWIKNTFGTVKPSQYPLIPNDIPNCNHQFYTKVFELLLRLKANYLWPAMWANDFNEDDPENPRLADEYGIVMGTSHQEPMLRSQQEWDRRYYNTLGHWDYTKYPDTLENFWREGIRRNKNYESIITMGLRGANDSEMGGDLKSNIAMVEKIVAKQQTILREELNPDITKIPQIWCLYKEIQEYYEHGMKVPDYITLLWSDDNWGNIRRLPSAEERKRSGGAGIYYHADYVGGPRSYKWINTIPVTKIWDQMSKAYEYGADRIWILNVGDIKPLEFPMDFFLNLAWNPHAWNKDNLTDYTKQWAELQFGKQQATDIADILDKYTKYNGWIKPELLSANTFSLVNYREAETVVSKWKAISDKANSIYTSLDPDKKDAFFQLVLYPTKASYTLNNFYFNLSKNHTYASQGRLSANDYALKTKELFIQDSLLTVTYHTQVAGGKWNGMMNQPHIGYRSWSDPKYNIMPHLECVQPSATENIGIAVEGYKTAISAQGQDTLPQFSNYTREKHYFDVFAKKPGMHSFDIKPLQSWIIPSVRKGSTDNELRVEVAIDWAKVPKGQNITGNIRITSATQSFNIAASIFNPEKPDRKNLKGFIESNGYVTMEAEHYSSNKEANGVQWQRIPGYGHTLSSMIPLPVTAQSFTDFSKAPVLEYNCYLFTTGKIEINTLIAPTLNNRFDADMRFAVAIDNEQPQIVQIPRISITGSGDSQVWSQSVINSIRVCKTEHNIRTRGYHKVKIFMMDPVVVLQRIVINTGGIKPSFFFPPESFYNNIKNDTK
ncbi:MAG: Immunoglobulin I-set domain protein [Bacteroidetes bacterium]|nr:Immunoglobulin I-set domain protein [Bacteroidota bacterium]